MAIESVRQLRVTAALVIFPLSCLLLWVSVAGGRGF